MNPILLQAAPAAATSLAALAMDPRVRARYLVDAAELLLGGTFAPLGLLLHRAERPEIALRLDHLLDGGGAECTDELVFEVCVAHVEAESLQLAARGR